MTYLLRHLKTIWILTTIKSVWTPPTLLQYWSISSSSSPFILKTSIFPHYFARVRCFTFALYKAPPHNSIQCPLPFQTKQIQVLHHILPKSSCLCPYPWSPPPPDFYRPTPNHLHSYVPLVQTISICHTWHMYVFMKMGSHISQIFQSNKTALNDFRSSNIGQQGINILFL